MNSRVSSSRAAIAKDLSAYGEEDAARRIESLSPEDYALVEEKAFDFACSTDPNSGRPMLIAKALSMAAVEIIEGKARDLKRKKRKFA
jgi:hypothetical protein